MAYEDEVLADEPFAYWRGDDAATPLTNLGSGGTGLAVTGGTFEAAGPFVDAVSFDGTDDSGSVALALGFTSVITVEVALNWAAYADDDALLMEFGGTYHENGGSFIIDPNNGNGGGEADTGFVAWLGGFGVSRWTFPRSALPAGEFHHVAWVLDRAEGVAKMYMDGSPVALTQVESAATPTTFANSTLSVMSRNGSSLFAEGIPAELAIYTYELPAERVAVHASFVTPSALVSARHSGGDGNTAGAASLGGEMGGTLAQTVGALFSTPTNTARLAGLTDYRALYLLNLGQGLAEDVRVWIATPSSQGDSDEAIGADPANPAQTIATATTAPTGVSFSAPDSYATGVQLGDIDTNESIPLWVERELGPESAEGERVITLGIGWDGNEDALEITIRYTVTIPVTLYVDADHPDRSDSWTREQSADDPDTPFASPQAAAMLLEPGDTMQVEESTLGQANPADTKDADVYPAITHLQSQDGSDNIPWAGNTGNEPITVTGNGRPKIRAINARGMKNWRFEHFQQGYDRGSGDDELTNGVLHACADLKFADIDYTGGGYYCIGCTGLMWWDQCEASSRYVQGGGFLAGNGFRVLDVDTSDGIYRPVTYRFTGNYMHGIEGEDAIQASLAAGYGRLEAVGNTFEDITQAETPGAPHTDCIQVLGGEEHLIVGNRFLNCSSPFIASDGVNGRTVLIGNVVDGPGNGFHGQGTAEWVIAHNTIKCHGIAIAIGDRHNTQTNPDFEQHLRIVNNVAGDIDIAAAAVIAEGSTVAGNVFYRQPGLDLGYGTNIAGLPELGTSARLTTAGLDGAYELANDPADSPGIGDGLTLTSENFPADLLEYVESDLLGRAFTAPPDCGAFQSDPATSVSPAPRPPYVTGFSPSADAQGVPAGQSVTVVLTPVPGQTIDAGTVTTETAWVTASNGAVAPAQVSVGEPDENGTQTVTINPTGRLRELVLYTVHLDGIEDSDGSAIVPTSWQFRGPDASALDEDAVGQVMSAGFLRDAVTKALIVVVAD